MFDNKINVIENIARDFSFYSILKQIDKLRLLKEKSVINISVVGKFKAGKSSFLNSLIGKKILPEGVVPVTGVITYIKWGEEEKVLVYFSNVDKKEVKIDKIAEYVSEEYNTKNKLGVDRVEVITPLMSDFKNIILMDTPGVESIFKHNSEVSLEWLYNVDYVILCINSDIPFSESDLDLIKKITLYTSRIITVVTKVDRVSDGEIKKITEFIKKELNNISLKLPVVPFSVKKNVYKEKFIENYIKPLLNNFEYKKKEIIEYKFNSLKNQCKELLEFYRNVVLKTDSEKQKLKHILTSEEFSVENFKRDLYLLYANIKKENSAKILNLILNYKNQLSSVLKDGLEKKLLKENLNLKEMIALYQSFMESELEKEFRKIFDIEKNSISDILNNSVSKLSSFPKTFREMIAHKVYEVLGISLPYVEFEIPALNVDFLYIRLFQEFDVHIELLWFIIPVRILKKLFVNHFVKQVDFEVEKNLTIFSMKISEKINKYLEFVIIETLNYMANIAENVEKSLDTYEIEIKKIEDFI